MYDNATKMSINEQVRSVFERGGQAIKSIDIVQKLQRQTRIYLQQIRFMQYICVKLLLYLLYLVKNVPDLSF